jgi:hypothetical protein
MESAEPEGDAPPAAETVHSSPRSIDRVLASRRSLAVAALVVAFCFSFFAIAITVSALTVAVCFALRTSRRFRVGLIVATLVAALAFPWVIGLGRMLGVPALPSNHYVPLFLPRPGQYEFDENSSCDQRSLQQVKDGTAPWLGKRQGLWWVASPFGPLRCGGYLE